MDYSVAIDLIAHTIALASKPLTGNQRAAMAGAVAMALEKAVTVEREALIDLAEKQGWAMKDESPFYESVRDICDMRPTPLDAAAGAVRQ